MQQPTRYESADSIGPPTMTWRILVIDDNFDAGSILMLLLRRKGHEVEIRNSGIEGIELAEVWRPAIILLDIGMPEMDGYETCQLIRQQTWGKDVIVVAQTGYGEAEDVQRSIDTGFDAHITKPVNVNELMVLLEELQKARINQE